MIKNTNQNSNKQLFSIVTLCVGTYDNRSTMSGLKNLETIEKI